MMANATALLAEHAEAVGLVYHDGTVVLVFQLHDFGQLAEVSLHREHTVDNDQLDGLGGKFLENTLQVFHIVVLIVQLRGKTQTPPVYDRGVVAVVANHVVATAHHRWNDTRVDREAGRKAQGVVFVFESGQLLLQLNVNVERAVEETAARTARAILLQCLLARLDDAVVAGEAGVGIAAEHQNLMAAHSHFRTLLACNFSEIGVNAGLHILLRQTVFLVLFL